MRRKFLSVVLCVCMMLTMAPFAFAAGTDTGSTTEGAGTSTPANSSSGAGGAGSVSTSTTNAITNETDLRTALESANDEDTITISGTISIDAPLVITKTVTLTGGSIIASDSFNANSNELAVANLVSLKTADKTLTLKDITLNGNGKALVVYSNAGKVVVDGATITGGKTNSYVAGVYMTNASQFEMNSGSITGNEVGDDYKNDGYTQYASDLWIGANANGALTAINGGTIGNIFVNSNEWSATNPGGFTMTGGNVQNLYVEYYNGYGASFTYNGGTIEHLYISSKLGNGDKVEVTPVAGTYTGGKLSEDVAEVNNVKYSTLASAIAAANANDTITLLKDATIYKYEVIKKSLTLDLGGHTLTSTRSGFDVYSDFTVKNGTVNTNTWGIWVQNGAKFTLDKTATVNADRNTTLDNASAVIAVGQNTTLDIYGTITAKNNFAVSGNGSKGQSGTTININDGAVIDAVNAPAIYHPQSGTLNIKGGTITGVDSAIAIKSGTLNISGGTITATGLDTTPTEGYSNGVNASGAAIQIESNKGYYGNPDNTYNTPHNESDEVQINVTDGTIESQNGVAIYEYLASGTTKSSVKGINISAGYIKSPKANFMVSQELSAGKISVTGGYFTSDPTTYVKDATDGSRYVVDSDVTGYSFKVTLDAPQTAPVIVADKTEAEAKLPAGTDSEVANSINNVINNANIDGVAEAVNKDAILSAANVSANDKNNKDAKIVIDVSVNVKATGVTTTDNKAISTLTFSATPVATVKKIEGATTTTYTDAPIDVPNSYLNGQAITVKLPLPAGFDAKQIKHTSTDGSVEYFLLTEKRGAKTFTIDKNNCAVFTITKFSTFEVSGTQTYVEPSSSNPGSSGGSISTPTTYAVNVNAATNGAVAADKKTASKGTTVTVTASPSKGYVVDAVKVVDKDGKDVAVTEKDGKYVFTMPASAVTVTGSFKAETPAPVALPFTDVKSGNWFYDAVKYAYAQGLMTGTSATTFAPNGTMNRAMIVTVLYRLEKSPAVTGASKFTDVPAGQWYSDAVAWAAANKIVNGYDETTFGPMNAVTREQMAAILFRYEQVKGLENVTLEENLNRFPDQNKISAYAIPALQWAVGQKIINGNADGTLDPTGTATRAQVAQIFTNLLNK